MGLSKQFKFKVKNGVTTPNIEFKESDAGTAITASMTDSTGTLSFEGSAGQLFSITDSLAGTLFAVNDISGIPSLEINDQGIVKIAEFNGKLIVGGDSEGDTTGVTIKSGAIQIRTDSAPGYVDFYCETNNAHRVRLKSPAHSAYTGQVDVTLPDSTGILALLSDVGSGGGTPGGANTQVQFNDGGAFAGNAGMTFNKSTGVFAATAKSFDIKHPTKEGMRLRYGSLEGPENGVYVRGRLKNGNIINLPDYWKKLVDHESITVELTPFGKHQDLYVESIENCKVSVKNASIFTNNVDCFFKVYGERKDIAQITVEYDV
jgi:hypothetical protein